MKIRFVPSLMLAAMPFLTASVFVTADAAASPRRAEPRPLPFASIDIHLETNVADQDAEAFLTVDSGLAMRSVTIRAPNGEIVLRLLGKGPLGQTKFKSETPEPSLADVQASYPEGRYRVIGETLAGDRVVGSVNVSHVMPAPPTITYPAADSTGVPVSGVAIAWTGVATAVKYVVELEQEDLGLILKADVQAGVSNFNVPEGYLLPGLSYVLGVSAIAANRNVTVDEVRFITAP